MYIALFIPIYKDYNQNPELNVLVISAISNLAGLAEMSLLRGVEGGVAESHGGGGGVGVHSDCVLCGRLGMISVLVDAERVLGVKCLAALVAGPGDVNMKLHVAPHVAQVIRLSAADSTAPD